jgi:ABC-type cobalamin/Fe3+-siderophores transport system ATPase subunit
MRKIININGLPGSGKTTLAEILARMLGATHFNADWARNTITSHLGFSAVDRVRQAATLGHLAAHAVKSNWVVVDFVNPTAATRQAFYEAADPDTYLGKEITVFSQERSTVKDIWLNTIPEGRFADTNAIFEPFHYAPLLKVDSFLNERQFNGLAKQIYDMVTFGVKEYHIRFNTHHAGGPLKWRIIDAQTMEESLASDFEIKGHLNPSMTLEHGVEKYNVLAKGFPRWEGTKFILEF